MDEKLKNLLEAATEESLKAWTDPKMVERGYGYLDRVEGLCFIDAKGIVAKVHGTNDYYTRVFCDETGNLESRCSCPVGHRCKHAVAMVALASKRLGEGAVIAEQPPQSELWRSAEAAFEKVEARLFEREKKLQEERAAKEREVAEMMRWLEERRTSLFSLFNGFLEKIEERRESGDLKGVLEALDQACSATDDSFDIEDYGGELYDLIDEISLVALDAINKSDMPDRDKLLFAHDAKMPYRYYVPPRPIYEELWEGALSKTFPKEVWGEVGDALKSRLDESVSDDDYDDDDLLSNVYDACGAYWRAGRGEDAFSLRKRFVTKTYNWGACADDLCRLGRREEAKSFLFEAWRFVRNPENGVWGDDGSGMIDKLSVIYAEERNFAYATALLAENWLAHVGRVDYCSDWRSLERILDMAGKAGLRREVFMALAHKIDTGYPLRAKICKIEPSPAPEPPTWPLPPTGLDWGIPRPLFSIDANWLEAEALLVRVAIHEGLLDEAARRYLALPSRPGGYCNVSKIDGPFDFEREVRAALASKYPMVASKIHARCQSDLPLE